MKPTFLNAKKPLLTVIIQAATPERVEYLTKASLQNGADAFGLQICRLNKQYQNGKDISAMFSLMDNKPVYITNYRHSENTGKTDTELAREMVSYATCGATLCDVMGDMFGISEDQTTTDPLAVAKQKEYIKELHKNGAEVLMSSHMQKFIDKERLLEIALQMEDRGADIAKIVTFANTKEEQIKNLEATLYLKEKLSIPFLFLSNGHCELIRRVGPVIGSCMYLCVYEHDEYSTPDQPLLTQARAVRESFNW